MIVLLYNEALIANQLDASLLSFVVSVLHEFDNVFLQKIPRELPSAQEIEYPIDFIPGGAIPNELAYI